MTRREWLRAYWPHVFGSAVACIVGLPAAVASYRHGMTVIERSSDPGMAAWLPMTTDGLLLASLVALWVRRLTGRRTGRGPWVTFGLGLAVAVATNLAGARTYIEQGSGWDVVEAVGWAVWPPVCLAVVLEIVAWIVVPDAVESGETGATDERTETGPAVDQRKLTDEEIVAEVRRLGIEPTRKALHNRFGVGSGRADRIKLAVEAPVRPHVVRSEGSAS